MKIFKGINVIRFLLRFSFLRVFNGFMVFFGIKVKLLWFRERNFKFVYLENVFFLRELILLKLRFSVWSDESLLKWFGKIVFNWFLDKLR